MLQAGVRWSDVADAYQAGKESAEKALAAVKGKADMALAFCTVSYDVAAFVKGIRSVVGDIPLMGSTSFTGIITPGGFIHKDKGAGAVMLLASEDMAFGVGSAEIGTDPRATGQKAVGRAIAQAGKKANDPVSFYFLIAPPGNEEMLMRGIEDVIGRVPMVGGSAADNKIAGDWKEFANGKVMANGVVVGLVYSQLPFAVAYTGYYKPTNKQGIITKVRDRRVLVEIDGKPAMQVYAEWRGMQAKDLLGGALLGATIPHPLGVRDVSGDLWWIRHPMNGNADGSMNVGSDLAEGTAVTMMAATPDEVAQGATEVVKMAVGSLGKKPGAVLIIHCGGRAALLGPERMEQVAASIKAVLGNVPFIGYCTFGEQGACGASGNGSGGLSLGALALGK